MPTILRISPLDTQMLHFLASVAKSKGFFLNIADTLCRDDSFAEQGDGKLCWNGERIGELVFYFCATFITMCTINIILFQINFVTLEM